MSAHHRAGSVQTASASPSSEAAALGSRLRLARMRAGVTLETIASAAGMTTGHLSRVERGEKLPSMGAILRLAAALGVSLGDLIGGAPVAGEVAVVRAKERSWLRMADGTDALRYEVLLQEAACAGQSVTAYVIDPAKELDAITPTSHAGLELIFVLEGAVEVQLGDKAEALGTGDSVLFPGYLKHMLRPVDARRKSRALIVIVSP